MTPEQYEHLTELFHAALEIAPGERAAFLDQVSESDADLRGELESLLAAEAAALTEKPPHDIAAGYLAQQGDNSANVPSLAPNTRLDHYEIRSLLGKGGMGEVYLAEDTRLHRKVALKILPAAVAANRDRMRRFEQEATAAAALNHPHIAHIYEIGESEGTHFIAIEHIDGETLRDKIHSDKAPLQKLLKYLTQVAEGLSKAHAAGIVHRDLKPDNIMITRDDYAKILDFGLAKLIEPQKPSGPGSAASSEVGTAIMAQHSLAGMVMGTAGYMSPEQAQGKVKEIDHRSDIFSFGCILYEAVTAHRPFADESVIKSLHKVAYESAPPLKDFNPSAPPDLQRIVRRCLAKDPDHRYQTSKDLALELREVRQGMTGAAELDTTVPPSGKIETLARGTTEQSATSTSSAEYLVSQIKSHKRAALLVLTVLVAVTAVASYFAYSRYGAKRNGAITDSTVGIRSVAVMPLANTSNDPDMEYLSDGISQSLINSLSQLPGLKVIDRSSSFKYKGKNADPQEVANALGVEAILTGRVTQRGDNLLISVELTDERDKTQVWGEQYNRKATDLLAVQSDISREIAATLRVKLTTAQQQQLVKRETANPQAYELLLKARFYGAKGGTEDKKKAIQYYQQAIAVDPAYALAYAELSGAYVDLVGNGNLDPKEGMPKAEEAARKALELDESLADAHLALAGLKLAAWDWATAEREFKRAIELNPNLAGAHHGYADYLCAKGRHDEASAEMNRVRELDPLSLWAHLGVGTTFWCARQYDQAIDAFKKTLDMDQGFAPAHVWLGYAYAAKGRYQEAIAAFQKYIKLSGDDPSIQVSLGKAYALAGQREKARAILKRLETTKEYVSPEELANLYVTLGEREKAFASLEKAYAAHDLQLQNLGSELDLDPLRSDPRFADLMRRIGLLQ